jgi:tetratricopeptide (TPR) repeat protein
MPESLESEIRQLYEDWIASPSAVVCARLADRIRLAGRSDEALEVARKGLAQWSANTSIRVVSARCLRSSGDSRGAREAFESVLEVDPLNLIALRNLAEIAYEEGRFADAVRLFGDYLFENPGDGEAEALMKEARKQERAPVRRQPEPVVAPPPPGQAAAPPEQVPDPSPAPAAGEVRPEPVEEPAQADYPRTARMDRILAEQGLAPRPGETPAVAEEAPDGPGSPAPAPEPGPAPVEEQAPAPVPPSYDPAPPAEARPQLRREPRSLFDLFTPEERSELFLEAYRQDAR